MKVQQLCSLLRGWSVVVALLASALVHHPASAQVTIDWVTVGNPGNAGQELIYSGTARTFGAVAYEYRIMKFEWTNSQYAQFLNAIDPAGSNPNAVWNVNMENNARGGISRDLGAAAGSRYAVKTDMGDKPVNYINWFQVARVANWLHNGGLTYGSTDNTANAPQNTGAYTLGTATSGTAPAKNADALFWIPTENEWYKAAYYNPTLNGGTGGYTVYGNGFDAILTAVTANDTGIGSASGGIIGSGTGNFANINNGAVWNGLTGNVTTVGTNGAASYYGAYDMSGNVAEWNDLNDTAQTDRGVRGGTFSQNATQASRSVRRDLVANAGSETFGFRLVSPVPEPATLALASGGAVCACGWWVLKGRRRVR
jgi:sulfatase modifying factor 1